MTQCIHYEDNIFMFFDLLKHLERGLKLDIDENYFEEKVVSDIFFVEEGLVRLFQSIRESTLQLAKSDYLRLLFKAVNLSISIIKDILSGSTGKSINFNRLNQRLSDSLTILEDISSEIQKTLATDETEEDAVQISQEEMEFLMTEPEDE